MSLATTDCHSTALSYAARGWHVFPIKARHKKPPLIKEWQNLASTDPNIINQWWSQWPSANLGVATGKFSGIVALDIDPRNGGDKTLQNILQNLGPLDVTITQITGGGGKHFLFKHPGHHVRSSKLGDGRWPGLDIKADGGYIVVAPSIHDSSNKYRWAEGLGPGEIELAPMPDWLLDLHNGTKRESQQLSDREKAIAALAALGPQRAVDHDEWVAVGMALHSVDGVLLTAWDSFSKQCPEKYRPGECAKRWQSFSENGNSKGRLGLGSLINWAKKDTGFEPTWSWQSSSGETSQAEKNKAESTCPHRKMRPLQFPMSDTGAAERMVWHFGDRIRYCYPWGKWLAWDGRRWNLDDTGEIDRLAKRTARLIFKEVAKIENKDKRDALIKFARKCESSAGRAAMIKLAQSEPGIPVLPDALDKNPWLLNVENGTLDLRTGKLQPHDKKNLMTKLAPVVFDPTAIMPQTEKFLDEIFDGDKELINFLQRFLGYTLTGDVSEQIFTLWHGKGANGKSTLLNAVFDVLGTDYSMKAGSDMFLVKFADAHPTALTDLFGKRFVAAIETDDGRRLAESLVKELVGGDRVRARRMREDFWEFSPTHKIVLACNHRPSVRGTDWAMWRRIKLVPFSVVIPEAQRDKDLPTKLKGERVGFFAWLVQGCLDWQRHGLGSPRAVIDATSDYSAEEDALAQFIFQCCVQDEWAKVRASDLVDAYTRWSGDKRITVRKMTKILKERDVEKYLNNGVWYRGIGLEATE